MKVVWVIGTKTVVIIATLIATVMGCNAFKSPLQSIPEYPNYESARKSITWDLVWSDEFDYRGLPDPSNWDYEVGYVRNNELQYYTESSIENARVENGLLIIETRKKSPSKIFYTSASLVTYKSKSWLYGRIEVRAKLPIGRGIWPAIFMIGRNIEEVGWPACGEIDIMENVGFDPDIIHGNIHTQAYNWVLGTNKGATIRIPLPHKSFHIYAIEWFEDKIDFFVDDKRYFTYENEDTGWETWPFAEKFFLIINTAFGGDWGGKYGVDDSILPQKFYIDYVRIYKVNRLGD
jgi:beta-glucanase (GH16 family)